MFRHLSGIAFLIDRSSLLSVGVWRTRVRLGGPPANIALSQDGRNILETPEVAQARAAHIAALQQASQNNPNPQDDGSYDPRWDNEEYWQNNEQRSWNGAPAASSWNGAHSNQWNAAPAAPSWNSAPATPTWNAAGAAPAPVAETPEVAQARAAHLAALSAAKPAGQQWNAPAQQQWNAPSSQWNGAPSWQGPPAQIRLAQNGNGILETPEVAAARAAHLAAHAQAGHGAPSHSPQQHW
ncbi:unnamed protein product, partial [Iphiclides podalirius]